MTANLSLSDIGAIPSNYAQTNDPTIFQNDEVWLVVKCSNQGSESGQFKVLMTLEGYGESHEEWIRNMQPGEEKWLTWTISPDHLSAGNQKFDVYADVTSRVDESNELDNHLEGYFTVTAGNRHATANMEGETIEVNPTDAEWAKAGWRRVDVYVQAWDYTNSVLTGYTGYLQVEGVDQWHQQYFDDGAVEYKQLLVHPSGTLHLVCHPADPNLPQLTGQFSSVIDQDGKVVVKAWQDMEQVMIQATSQRAVAEQLTASGKASFKILDIGFEAGGSVSQTTTDTEGRSRSWRVLLPKEQLLPQQPARGN